MGILITESLDRLRAQLPENLREKWTDEELDTTAYFLAISGFVPGGMIGAADISVVTVGLVSNLIAASLLAPYLIHGVLDPVVINQFVRDLKDGTISHDQFLTAKNLS